MWYVVRHPETIWNSAHRYQGWSDIALSVKGERQREQMVTFLSNLKDIAVIISSDLQRCSDIAKRVVEHKQSTGEKIELVLSREIRELNFGTWEGKTYYEIQSIEPQHQKKWLDDPYQYSPPKGESLNTLIHRATSFLEAYRDKNCLIITHGGVIGVIINHWFNEDIMSSRPKLGTCIRIDFNKGWQEIH